jgi:hypothetical protein
MLTRLAGLAVGLAAASAMIIGAGILTSGHGNAAGPTSSSPPVQQVPGTWNQGTDGPGHMRFWMHGGPGAIGRVTKVSGNTITMQTPDGQTVTVTVGSSTQYHGKDTSASLKAITPGTTIAVMGTRSGNTIQATDIAIIPPHAVGTVTKVDGNTISITPRTGELDSTKVTKIVTSSSTIYQAAGTASASASSIKVGDIVIAVGTLSADGTTLNATRVLIGAPGTAGPFGGHLFGHGFFGHGPGGFPGGWGTDRGPQFVSGNGPSV